MKQGCSTIFVPGFQHFVFLQNVFDQLDITFSAGEHKGSFATFLLSFTLDLCPMSHQILDALERVVDSFRVAAFDRRM